MIFPLVGNERIKDAVLAFVYESRIPHAILIEGEKGTGRHTLSHFLAFSAVCTGENPPCNDCRGCKMAENRSHPDIALIEPEDGKKNISVAQIRTVRSEAYVKPHMAKRRVFIIDKADSMNEQAENALLKVLEEPPGDIIFILIAESASVLLDTIISRCTVLSLIPPEISVSAEYLKSHTKYEQSNIEEALKETGGNIGNALHILVGEETKAQSCANKFIEFFLKENEAEMLKITAQFEKSRVDADLFIKELKISLAAAIRKNHKNIYMAKALMNLYDEVPSLEVALKTNINLSLLFCQLVCKAAESNM